MTDKPKDGYPFVLEVTDSPDLESVSYKIAAWSEEEQLFICDGEWNDIEYRLRGESVPTNDNSHMDRFWDLREVTKYKMAEHRLEQYQALIEEIKELIDKSMFHKKGGTHDNSL